MENCSKFTNYLQQFLLNSSDDEQSHSSETEAGSRYNFAYFYDDEVYESAINASNADAQPSDDEGDDEDENEDEDENQDEDQDEDDEKNEKKDVKKDEKNNEKQDVKQSPAGENEGVAETSGTERWRSLPLPPCPRQLLLSESALATLDYHSRLTDFAHRGFVLVLVLVAAVAYQISLSMMIGQTVRHLRVYSELINPRPTGVRTLCAVIENLEKQKSNKFLGLPYAFVRRPLQHSQLADNFIHCYHLYYLPNKDRFASFVNGEFVWDHREMLKRIRAEDGWWLQPLDLGQPIDKGNLIGQTQQLTLSVVTSGCDPRRKAPVLLLVTGNDLIVNKPTLPPVSVAAEINCVIVSANYRLGLLGAASLGLDDFNGNLAAKDIVMVLWWIHETIREFGGDPDRILFYGEGAGATIGFWLLQSPDIDMVHRYWLIDASIQMDSKTANLTIIDKVEVRLIDSNVSSSRNEDPGTVVMGSDQLLNCYSQLILRNSTDCLENLTGEQILLHSPETVLKVHEYLDQFPSYERLKPISLLTVPENNRTVKNLLEQLRLGILPLKPLVLGANSYSAFYANLFIQLANLTRYELEKRLNNSMVRVQEKEHNTDNLMQLYVDFITNEMDITEDQLDFEPVQRLVLHDLRQVCPVLAAAYHLLAGNSDHPLYSLIDVGPYQAIDSLYTRSNADTCHCHLPRTLQALHSECSLSAKFDAIGQETLQNYWSAARKMIREFAQNSVQKSTMEQSAEHDFESTINLVDHLGSLPGVDTMRSRLIKTACHSFYGNHLEDWSALSASARFN